MDSENKFSGGGRRPAAVYEPGELEKTRKNLGLLDAEEAQMMMKKLGGQIGVEKTPTFDESKMPARTRNYVSRSSSAGSSGSSGSSGSYGGGSGSSGGSRSESYSSSAGSSTHSTVVTKAAPPKDALPNLDSKIRQAMDEILISNGIKPKLNFISLIISRAFNRQDRVTDEFLEDQLAVHMKQLHIFADAVRSMVERTDDSYKTKIDEDKSSYFRTIKVVNSWNEKSVMTLYHKIVTGTDVTIQKLVPLVKEIYALLYKLYFLGPERVVQYMKRLSADVALLDKSNQSEQLQSVERNAVSSWLYLYEHCMKGLYPLLMRMCCSDLVLYPEIMRTESASILNFLGMTKFDVIFPDKDETAETVKEAPKESAKDAELRSREAQYRDQIVKGINILDLMFPQSGWKKINAMPDMYSYFHGLYKFKDGINYLNRENPLLITMMLLRISEDFLVGCRNMKFTPDSELRSIIENQNIDEFIDSWAEYREVLYERNYMKLMLDYVNNMYANLEYANTQFGKKAISNLQWYAHNQFLPLLKFELKFLDKQEADNVLPPLYRQVSMLREFFNEIVERADNALQTKGEEAYSDTTLGVDGLWNPYKFAIGTPVSKRLDVLLGGRQSKQANNLNLLKYTCSVLAVLDWWINNKASPAYTVANPEKIFRCDDEGVPIFSVKPMENVNELFAENLKRTMGKK